MITDRLCIQRNQRVMIFMHEIVLIKAEPSLLTWHAGATKGALKSPLVHCGNRSSSFFFFFFFFCVEVLRQLASMLLRHCHPQAVFLGLVSYDKEHAGIYSRSSHDPGCREWLHWIIAGYLLYFMMVSIGRQLPQKNRACRKEFIVLCQFGCETWKRNIE